MLFVKTIPDAITWAAGQLGGIGQTLAAQNAAALTPTTLIAPAGADPVSQIQAALFGTYGNLYQSISDQATAVHQQLVETLGQNAAAYDDAEATNQATTAMSSAMDDFFSDILGVPTSGSTSVLSGNAANVANIGFGNWASAGSSLLGLAGGGLLDAPEEAVAGGSVGGLAEAALLGAAVPPTGIGATPVLASAAQSAHVGELSVPPSWAADRLPVTDPTAVRLVSAASTAPAVAPAAPPLAAAVPAAAAAAAGRGLGGFGAPRYGVKPKVMPKPSSG